MKRARILLSLIKGHTFLYLKTLLITLLSLISLYNATSLASNKTATLEEIVVTATKVEEPKKDVPAFVQIIKQEDIKLSTAKDVGDLISEAALGHIHKYPGALTARIAIRGLPTDLFSPLKSRVLILINGHQSGTVNLAKIPVEDIERIEIVKGPASVLYGSSAMGGVINIITKEGKEGIQGLIGGEVGSWRFWKALGELSGKRENLDFFFTTSRSSREDYKAKGYGRIANTAYDDEMFSARMGYKFLQKHYVYFNFQHWKGWDIGSPGARYSPDPDDFSNKERNAFETGYKTERFSAMYYLVKDKDEWHSSWPPGPGNDRISKTKTDTQGIHLQKIFPLGEHRIVIGGQWDRVEVKSRRNVGAPYNPDSKYDSFGTFAEGRLGLLEKRLLLSAGLRYDYFRNSILSTPGIASLKPRTEDLDHLTARGGLVFKFTDVLSIKGNLGTAFRAPAPDELAADYQSAFGRYLGNPNLKPEKSISFDTGVEYSKDFTKVSFAFFHTKFKDKILSYYDNALNARTFKNVEGAIIQGIETNLSYDIGLALKLGLSLELFTDITYHTKFTTKDKGEIERYGKTLLYTPKWRGSFGVRMNSKKWEMRLVANYIGDEKVEDWNRTSPTYGKAIKKKDFTVVNLKAAFRPIKHLEITGAIENLFDKEYEYVRGYPMPKRTITTGMKWLF